MEKNQSRARVGYVDYVRVFAMVMVILLLYVANIMMNLMTS